MDRSKRIYIIFISIFLILWNPLSLKVIYSGSDVTDIRIIKYLYWFTFLAGLTFLFLIIKIKLSDRIKNIILSLILGGIFFSSLVVFNLLIGLFQSEEENDFQGLMFPPNTKAYYKTIDFEFTAHINSIGLRENEFTIDKGDNYRIVCFGDSWTVGWGVDLEYSWPKVLEKLFKDNGFNNVEVINCAKGGDFTVSYKSKMEPVLVLLKPDLVLVGVLQGNDMIQAFQYSMFDNQKNVNAGRVFTYIKDSFMKYLLASFENFIELIKGNNAELLDIEENYKIMVDEQISNYNEYQRIRYFTIDDTLKNLFVSGNLNPSLLWEYINFPENYFIINDSQNAASIAAANQVKQDLSEIKDLCKKYSAEVVYINLPETEFIGHKVVRSALVNNLNDYLSINNRIDPIHKSIADYVNIPYLQLTERFEQLEDKNAYFFKYDGHPNQRGYEEMAKGIYGFLINDYKLHLKFKSE